VRFSWDERPVFCFTADIDWASEHVISHSHAAVGGADLRITYFNTHPSQYLNELTVNGECSQLIHPNFLPGSSHGSSYQEVMDYCRRLVPEADGFRTHRYFEVNDVLDEFANRGFKFFSNHCTRCESNLRPLVHRSGMVSLPIFLEDGGYLISDPTLNFDALIAKLETPGLKIINFHPAHMAINTPRFSYTREIKDRLTREEWNDISVEHLAKLTYDGHGVRDIIRAIGEFVRERGYAVNTMHEIYAEFVAKKAAP
jgi:hypothetical protein